MEMSACMALVGKMNQADADGLIDRVDGYISAGMAPQDAQRMAIDDMLAEIQQDRSESEAAVREQHAELFVVAPEPAAEPGPYVSRFFEGPRQARVAPDTAAFKKWFAGSEVVDADGNPMVVYHGTTGDFNEFKRIDGGNAYGPGYYFTANPAEASGYADGTGGGRMRPDGDAAPNLMPVYLSARNIFTLDGRALTKAEIAGLEAASNKLSPGTWKKGELAKAFDRAYPATAQNVIQYVAEQAGGSYASLAQAAGYDGLLGGYGYVVFRPEQIKSAIGNDGSFDGTNPDIRQSRAQPTYISRPLANAQDLHDWAVASGIKNVVPPEKMHTTIAYSKAPIDTAELPRAGEIPIVDGGKRSIEVMGDDEVIALRYESPALQKRWQQTLDIGATWDHGHSKGSFKPHITISYEKQPLPAGLQPYTGPLILGPEKSELLQTSWSKTQGLDGAPAQNRILAQDAEEQQAWLNERARAMGYTDIDQLVDSDFDAFMSLAEQWREMNPAEVMQARAMYRGTTGSEERIVGGIAEGVLFAAATEKVARLYAGSSGTVEKIVAKDGAKILVEGSREYARVTGRRQGKLVNTMRSGENLKTAGDDVVAAARAAGYDAFEFTSFADLGIAILNEGAFDRQLVRPSTVQVGEEMPNKEADLLYKSGDSPSQSRAYYTVQVGPSGAAQVGAQRPPAGYQLPEFGVGSRIVEAIQNRYNRWKQTIAAVAKQGGVLNGFNDFYRAEERYHGKVSSRVEDFDGELQQFIKDVAADGVTLKDVQLYAYAMHAKERNDYLRTKREANPMTGFDSWSGMTDDDAQAILDDAQQAGLDTVLAKHQATLQKWIQGTRDVMLDEGLITDDQYLMLNAAYANYVPLRGKPGASKARGNGTGSGFNIRGKETEKARGRYSEADNIIEYIIQDRVKALTRAGKNEVLRTFLQFVIDNPDPSLWEINAVEKKPLFTVDDRGNQVIGEANQVVKDDRTVGIKDGGREVFVLIRDEVLREQMKNMNVEQASKAIGVMLMAQRALGRMYTSLNPVFTVINWARDVQAATMGMIDEVGYRGAAKLWGAIPKAIYESFRAEFGTPSPDYQMFRATGGKTGFMNFRDIEDQAKDLTKRLADANRSFANPMWWGPAALNLVESINAGIENGTRFAAWQAARSEGKALAEASSISKNITVNFNRKGTWTPQLSAWFLFFNPAVQGTARIAQSLRDPKVLAVLGAAMGGVALLALQNASMGEDDDDVSWWDKIPQETKDRNLIIMLPPGSSSGDAVPGSKDGRYVKIPMPYGWNFFATMANQMVDLWRNGIDPARGVGPAKAAKNVASSFLGAYMPVQEVARSVQNSKSAVLSAVPDFLNAPAQSVLNMNSFGRDMYPEDRFGQNLPDSTKMFPAQAGTIFQKAAEGLNAATGGTKYSPGYLDFTPATIEGLARAYGGGPVSFSLDIMNSMYARTSIERPDLDARRMPFVKQLYGRIDAETERAISFERMDAIDAAVKPVAAARKAGDNEAAKAMAEEGGAIYKLGGALEITRDKLSRIREQELKIIASKEPDSVRYARLQAMAAQKERVLQELNRAYNAALRAEGKPKP